jgi:hypothetical protein
MHYYGDHNNSCNKVSLSFFLQETSFPTIVSMMSLRKANYILGVIIDIKNKLQYTDR